MLNGGLTRWKAEGNPVLADTDINTVRPTRIQVSVATGCHAPIDEVARRAFLQCLFRVEVCGPAGCAKLLRFVARMVGAHRPASRIEGGQSGLMLDAFTTFVHFAVSLRR
jgi:hypothetical protein